MCRRMIGNEEHPVRIIFGVHSFCSCFIWSLHTTSVSSRSACITSLAIEYDVRPEYGANVAKSCLHVSLT